MSREYPPLVGKLLGYQRHRTTADYAHLADRHLVEASEKTGSAIAEAMGLRVALNLEMVDRNVTCSVSAIRTTRCYRPFWRAAHW